jgi:hypothetical protein
MPEYDNIWTVAGNFACVTMAGAEFTMAARHNALVMWRTLALANKRFIALCNDNAIG